MAERNKLPEVTAANYYSKKINQAYMSASQFKAFADCEARALAELRGDWPREATEAMLVGSYVDAYFSGETEAFCEAHPEIVGQDGLLKAQFSQAWTVIDRIKRDPLFFTMISGATQEIRTGVIGGIPFKIKMDSLLSEAQCDEIVRQFPGMAGAMLFADGAIVDLKVMRTLSNQWVAGKGRVSFVEAWGYDLQMAVYQAVEGRGLPCYIAAASKEAQTDLAVLHIPQAAVNERLLYVEEMAGRFAAVKTGKVEAVRCERCDYCKATRVLTGAEDYRYYGMEDEE